MRRNDVAQHRHCNEPLLSRRVGESESHPRTTIIEYYVLAREQAVVAIFGCCRPYFGMVLLLMPVYHLERKTETVMVKRKEKRIVKVKSP
ncbi:hypothetical protein G4O51_01635 [Candidatus Bathyarchaeota archaeon A05DMB-2]|nr:hypothetical protein [Candidatus Bathyarchaeota archaeon A05DMB-2]